MKPPQESSASNTSAQPEQEIAAPAEMDAAPGRDAARATDAPKESGVDQPLAQMQQQMEALKEALQRERADFLNYRRRAAQERDELSQRVRAEVLGTFLPALDDLERALHQIAGERSRQPWVEGFRLVGRKLLTRLEQAGVARIGAPGEPFNPHLHEAVAVRPAAKDGEQVGAIAEVVRPGYRLGDYVLRPAQVIVVGDTTTSADRLDTADSHAG